MRLAALLSTAILAASAGLAQAQPVGPVADVRITIGPELLDKADKLGAREFDFLARDLRHSIEARLGRAGALSPTGGVLDLTIVDATPNRPTFEQLGDKPGLSMDSYGIGGAEIAGAYVTSDGARIPVTYRWYESDIRNSRHATTWSDAQRTFDRFAERLVRGDAYAQR